MTFYLERHYSRNVQHGNPISRQNMLDTEMWVPISRFIPVSKLTCYVANYIMVSEHFYLLGEDAFQQ